MKKHLPVILIILVCFLGSFVISPIFNIPVKEARAGIFDGLFKGFFKLLGNLAGALAKGVCIPIKEVFGQDMNEKCVALAPIIGVAAAIEYFLPASGKTIQDTIIDTLKGYLKKKLLDYFTDSIIRWIQGEDDKPAFVTNWRKFMGDVVNDAVGSYIETTKFAGLCDTFNFQVRVSLPRPGRPALPTCTLDRIVGNIENFYSDFRSGGWLAYNEMLYPQNNPYGAYMIAIEGAAYEAITAQQEKQQEVDQSKGGFLNTKRCKHYWTEPLTQAQICLEWENTTPGGVIADKLSDALRLDTESILTAKEFEQYAIMILDAVTNRLFRAGADGLLGLTTKSAPEDYKDLGYVANVSSYTCDTTVGTCIVSSLGTYDSIEECDKNCKVKYTCDENSYTCVVSPLGEYTREEDCEKGCKEPFDNSDWPYPTCDACKVGVYVRGRGTPGVSTGGACSQINNGKCTLCSAVTSGTAGGGGGLLCQTFCEATREEAWGGKTEVSLPRVFTREEMKPFALIFGGEGKIPSSCSCSYANNYKNLNEFSFGSGYTHDNSACFKCTKLPESAKNLSVWPDPAETRWVCDESEWCDKYCCDGCPPPPPHDTLI